MIKIKKFIIAIDIGTTTLVMSLIDRETKKLVKQYTELNNQRIFGRNVIDRIKAANDGKQDKLRSIIIEEIKQGIIGLIGDINKENIEQIVIACNTTMSHILLNYPCDNLGRYPYTPYNIDLIELPFNEMFKSDLLNIKTIILPGISTFVGGDIVSGLYHCGFNKMTEPSILIDLGTNGEMAIGNKDKIIVISAAVGPAFEGGNIAYGVDAVAITSDLLKNNIIDETGLLNDKYFEDGYLFEDTNIKFTQKNIREIQLAKAAVRAGIEVLIKNYNIKYQQVDKVYLAGGFGYHLNTIKGIAIGLLPKEFSDKIISIGNSSLKGAIDYSFDVKSKNKINKIIKVSQEVNLSNDNMFNELYIKNMNF